MIMPNPAVTPEPEITIGIAATAAEKRAIYRLRYHVYAQEMARRLPSIDHRNQLVTDDLDEWGILLYAKAGQELIGTQAVNIGPLAQFSPKMTRLLSLDKLQSFALENAQPNFAYIGKLIVAPWHRNSMATYLLMAKGYELYCQHKVQFNFGVCKFHLLRLYEQFGYRRFSTNFAAPGYDGVMVPLVLLVDDVDHLRAVRSPFYRLARKRGVSGEQVSAWFSREFSEYASVVNSQLVTAEELWFILHQRLRRTPNMAISALRGLSTSEAQQLLHGCGIIIQCRAGEQVTYRSDVSHNLNILLTGRLQSGTYPEPGAPTILPGQFFGAVGLADQSRYTEDIFAATDSEILVLSRLGFQRFQHSHPAIADQVLQNIARLTTTIQPSPDLIPPQPLAR